MPARTFTWAPSRAARGYRVTFYRDGAKVFEAHVRRPRLELPPSFRFVSGSYRWRVIPLLPRRIGAPAIVDSTFIVSSSSLRR